MGRSLSPKFETWHLFFKFCLSDKSFVHFFSLHFCLVLPNKIENVLFSPSLSLFCLSPVFFLTSPPPRHIRPFLSICRLMWIISYDGLCGKILIFCARWVCVSLVKTPCPLPPPHCSFSSLWVGCSRQHSWVCALRWARILHPEWGASRLHLAFPRSNKREKNKWDLLSDSFTPPAFLKTRCKPLSYMSSCSKKIREAR